MHRKIAISPAEGQDIKPAWPQHLAPNLAMLALMALILFYPIFLHPNKMLWANDVVRAHTEYKQVQWRSFWVWGSFPLWDPTVYCGKSIVGDPLPALLNPLATIFWLIPSPSLFGFFLWLNVVLCAWGMFLYLREKDCDALGCLVGAMGFGFCGKTAAHIFAGHVELVSTMLALPWILWALERVCKRPSMVRAFTFGAALTFAAFGGSVQVLYWHLLFLGVYLLLWTMSQAQERSARDLAFSWLGALGGLGIFTLLAAPWWLPIIRQTLLLSARAQTKTLEMAVQGSAGFSDLLRLIWSNFSIPHAQMGASDAANGFFWETASHPGIIIVGLALASFFAVKDARGIISLACLALLTGGLALGENSPFFWLAYKVIPGFTYFRCPGRLFFYTNFALAAMAGIMISKGTSEHARWMGTSVFLVAFHVLLFGGLVLYRHAGPFSGFWLPILLCGLVALVFFIAAIERLPRTGLTIAILACLCLDFYSIWKPLINVVEPQRVLPRLAFAEFLADKHKESPFRVYDATGTIEQQTAARYGLELITGYHPGISMRHLELYRLLWERDVSDATEQYLHSPFELRCAPVLDMMNVKYVIAFEPNLGPEYTPVMATTPREFDQPRYLHERKNALSRGWIVGKTRVPELNKTLFDVVCSLDVRNECLSEETSKDSEAPFRELIIERLAPGNFLATCELPHAATAVFSETWHPDWVATDNSLPVSLKRVNHNFLGVELAPGNHHLHIWYRPWDFYLGMVVSLSTIVASCAIWLMGFICWRSPKRQNLLGSRQ